MNISREKTIELAASDYDQLVAIIHRTNDIETLVNLIRPNTMYDVLKNACAKLIELAEVVMKQCYQSNYYRMSCAARERLEPSSEMSNRILNAITKNHNKVNMSLDNYDYMYVAFIDKVNYEMKYHKTRSLGGATLGGMAAGMMFGPIGAFIGGVAGACMTDTAVGDNLRDRFMTVFNEFSATLDDVGTYIIEMVDSLLEILSSYENIFDGHHYID